MTINKKEYSKLRTLVPALSEREDLSKVENDSHKKQNLLTILKIGDFLGTIGIGISMG